MNTNYTQKEGDKSYVKLKNQINELPTEKIADKLELKLKKSGKQRQGECPSGHSSKGVIVLPLIQKIRCGSASIVD